MFYLAESVIYFCSFKSDIRYIIIADLEVKIQSERKCFPVQRQFWLVLLVAMSTTTSGGLGAVRKVGLNFQNLRLERQHRTIAKFSKTKHWIVIQNATIELMMWDTSGFMEARSLMAFCDLLLCLVTADVWWYLMILRTFDDCTKRLARLNAVLWNGLISDIWCLLGLDDVGIFGDW